MNFIPNAMSPKRTNVRNTAKVSVHDGAELGLSAFLAGFPCNTTTNVNWSARAKE